jgi:DNA-binding response OmpR family regulator
MRVLVVEDQTELAETLATGLRREGMAVDLAFDGDAALQAASIHEYDVIVLDRDLPRVHGDQVCTTLVERGARAGVLMLTASAGIEDRVVGLSLGADDYLPKPFAFAELVARVRALTRRTQPALPPVLSKGDLRLDPGARVAHRSGRRLDLSIKELAVLELLLAAQGTVVSAEELLERAWDDAMDPFSGVVKVTISRL